MPRLFRFLFIGGLILIVSLFTVVAFLPKESPPPNTQPSAFEPPPKPRKGVAPALALPRVDGGTFSLASYHGKSPVLLYFFATW